jgi:hypothetical protein
MATVAPGTETETETEPKPTAATMAPADDVDVDVDVDADAGADTAEPPPPTDQTFQDWWRVRNYAFLTSVPIVQGLAKNLRDARAAGVKQLEFPVEFVKHVAAAVKEVNAADPESGWAGTSQYGPFHLFVHIRPLPK